MIDSMLTIGSRGSKLALWQANWVAARLNELGERTRIEIIKTTGDKITDVALSKVGAKGMFTKEIEDALLDGSVDVAVHSLKDMPTELPRGLRFSAIPEREDPRDAIVGCRLDDLARGAKIGTSSLRRAAQVRVLRPDLVVESVRGNLDTRLRKLDEGLYDAIVLAAAGLKRLGQEERIAEFMAVDRMVPAVGQGALAIETRDEESPATVLCAKLHDEATGIAIRAERALLATLGGGCQVPIGAHARVEDGAVYIDGIVIAPDGGRPVRGREQGPVSDADEVGRRLGEALLDAGADEILEEVYGG
jgi:hydroxymethylbilane synthase